jgi:hypothetical protein
MLSSVSTNISTPGFGFFSCGKIIGVIKPINRGGNKRKNCLFNCVSFSSGQSLDQNVSHQLEKMCTEVVMSFDWSQISIP